MGGDPIPASSTLTATVKKRNRYGHRGRTPRGECLYSGLYRIGYEFSYGKRVRRYPYRTGCFRRRIYTGADVPAPIENITCTLSSDMMSLDISWTAPVTGAHGGDLDPKGITYQILPLQQFRSGKRVATYR